MSIGGHQSARAGTTTWLTPPWVIDALGEFDLDPCTPPEMPWDTARCRYTEAEDGLSLPWFGRVWLNPPYGREADTWLERMVAHGTGTALIFARTETAAFFAHVWREAAALLFLDSRLHFHHADGTRAKANSGAPSVLIAYGLDDADVLASCPLDGAFVPLSCLGQTTLVVRHEPADMSWRELIEAIAEREGGRLSLAVAYAMVRGHPKAARNPNWQAKVRQTFARAGFERVGPGKYERI
jgi:hypothetical protein